jgi:hypothetical protein
MKDEIAFSPGTSEAKYILKSYCFQVVFCELVPLILDFGILFPGTNKKKSFFKSYVFKNRFF